MKSAFLRRPLWNPGRKIHLMWTLRRNLSAETDSPWPTEGPSFINNNNLATIYLQELLLCSIDQEKPHTEPSASLTMPHIFMLLESTTAGKLYFCLSNNRLRPAPSNQNCTVWIPCLHKMDLIETFWGGVLVLVLGGSGASCALLSKCWFWLWTLAHLFRM